MKKFLVVFGLVLGISSLVYATMFCCPPDKTSEQCCAERGRLYCENENLCRTRCRNVAPPECIGGCINPDGECCLWCPTAEVCAYKGLCQRIVDGCYICDTCDLECPSPKCLNEEGTCCDSCPRTCPDGECLVNVDGCYECGECGAVDDDDDADDDDDDPCEGLPPCPEEKVRNTETCACECETVLACSEAHLATWNPETCQCDCKDEDHIYAYCGISEEGIPEDQKKENNEVCDCVCPQGKTECGSNRCCDLCNADNTRCCDAESICVNDEYCGENEICLHIGCCVEDNVCGEGENAECCGEGEDCCKDTCCSVDEVCADKATGTCCPMETPVKCGEECCENGCNKEGNGCSICEKGQQECGEKCCSETQECCNDECYDKCSQGFGRNSACQCNECETGEDCGLSLSWECSFGKCINEEELQANSKEQLELYYSGKGYTATIEGPFKDRGTCCGYYEDDGSFYYNCVIKDPNAEEWEAIIVEDPICSDPCLCYGC